MDQPRTIKQPIKPTRHSPKYRKAILQVDVQPAEEDPIDRDILFIRANGGVGRNELNIDPHPGQSGRHRVVAHATAAEHPRRPGGQVRYPGVFRHPPGDFRQRPVLPLRFRQAGMINLRDYSWGTSEDR